MTPNLTLNVGLRWDPYLAVLQRPRGISITSASSSSAAACGARVFRNAPVGVMFEGDPGYPGNAVSENVSAELRAAAGGGVGPARRRTHDGPRRLGPLLRPAAHAGSSSGSIDGTPFGTRARREQCARSTIPWVNTPGGNPFPIVAQPDMIVPAGRWVRHVPARHEAAVLGPVERQRAATARRIVDGFGELPQQPRPPPAGRRSAEPGDLQPGRDHGTTTSERGCCRSRTRAEGRFYGAIIGVTPVGTSEYNALLLSAAAPRGATGLFVSGKYTMSECISDVVNYEPSVAGIDLTKPGDAGVRSRQLRRDRSAARRQPVDGVPGAGRSRRHAQ